MHASIRPWLSPVFLIILRSTERAPLYMQDRNSFGITKREMFGVKVLGQLQILKNTYTSGRFILKQGAW